MEFFTENLYQLLLLGILLVLSGFFSGSETALFSLKPHDLNRFRRKSGIFASAVLFLHSQLPDFLLTVLLANMIVNILFFSVITTLTGGISEHWGEGAGAAASFLALLLLIITGEVTPKNLAASASFHFSMITALPMSLLHRLLTPLCYILKIILNALERLLKIKQSKHDAAEELKLLIELGQSSGIISKAENSLLSAVVDLPAITAAEIMTPRINVAVINSDAKREEVVNLARLKGHSKIPLRDPQTEEFTGWVDAREAFFMLKEKSPVTDIIREPLYLSEFDRCDQILRKFLSTENGLAIVVDERGATAGIICLSDLAGEIFGEMGDEDSAPSELITQEGLNTYIIDGRLSLREWSAIFKSNFKLPGISTVSGLVTALQGRPPKKGETVQVSGMELEILNVAHRRATRLKLTLNQSSGFEEERTEA